MCADFPIDTVDLYRLGRRELVEEVAHVFLLFSIDDELIELTGSKVVSQEILTILSIRPKWIVVFVDEMNIGASTVFILIASQLSGSGATATTRDSAWCRTIIKFEILINFQTTRSRLYRRHFSEV